MITESRSDGENEDDAHENRFGEGENEELLSEGVLLYLFEHDKERRWC